MSFSFRTLICSAKVYWFPLFLLIYALPTLLYGASDSLSLLPPAKKQRRPVYVGGFVGPVIGIAATDFFDVYNTLFGGIENAFGAALSAGFITKTRIAPGLWVGATVETYKSDLLESYSQSFRPGPDSIFYVRSIGQDFQMRVIPVLLTLEVSPVESQFKSYGGVGVGLSYVNMYWAESVSSTFIYDQRRGGTYFNEYKFTPAFRIYMGTQLGFDRDEEAKFLHGIFLEVRYTYIPLKIPIFQKVAEQFTPTQAVLNDSYLIQPGGISLVVGLLLQFLSK